MSSAYVYIHARLALKGDGFGGLMIFKTCRNLLRTLPAVVYSRTGNVEDIDNSCEDRALDSLRYGLTRKKYTFNTVPVTFTTGDGREPLPTQRYILTMA